MACLTTELDLVGEERRSVSQVVFGELLALLLNCSAEIFVSRLLELQSIVKIWSSSELARCETEVTNCDTEITNEPQPIAETLPDIKLNIKPECIANCTVQSDVATTLTSQDETCEFPILASNQDSIESMTLVPNGDQSKALRYSLRKHLVRKQTTKRADIVAKRQRLLRQLTVISNVEILNSAQQISPFKISMKTTDTDTAGSSDNCEESAPSGMSSCTDNISLSSTGRTQRSNSKRVTLVPLRQKKTASKICQCPICDAELPSRKLIKRHIKDQHISSIEAEMINAQPLELSAADLNVSCTDESVRPARFDCPDCGLTVGSAGSLKRHKTDIHGTDKRQYTCEICGVSVSSVSSLSRHKVLVHNPQRKHVCGDCGRAFAMRQTLQQHVNGVHLKNRPHLCSLCGDRFLKKDNLRNHMRLVHRDN